MSAQTQYTELKNRIWQIADSVRGAVDGWDFKQYILGTLFYRFVSENFVDYMQNGDDSINYAGMSDDDPRLTQAFKDDTIKTKGYFIYPSQLFSNVVKTAYQNDALNTDLKAIFSAIEDSAKGYASESNIKDLFADFDTTSNRLGGTVHEKNERLANILSGINKIDFGHFSNSQIDVFGDAYEFLISQYASNAGKSGGEFFTPQEVSKLVASLALFKQTSVNKIYDPACGSGSLLLQAKKQFSGYIEEGFFGQEINQTTYNLARINMFLHNVNYHDFSIAYGNTLTNPAFLDERPFDAIVSNPPYSVSWKGGDDPTLINDARFAPAGVLAPKTKGDFAFIMHTLHYLSAKGRAAIVCFPGIFYRSGAEAKIRQFLVENNYIESIIALPSDLFFGTSIETCILVLSKNKNSTDVQFINAGDLFKKHTNKNVLMDAHIEQIMDAFAKKENVDHFCQNASVEDIKAQNYNLSVSTYVEAADTREVINIDEVNAALKQTVAKIDALRADIDAIIAEIEGAKWANKTI